jgi:hypothetical protein
MDGLIFIANENQLKKVLIKNYLLGRDQYVRQAFPVSYYRDKYGNYYRKGTGVGKFFDPGRHSNLERINDDKEYQLQTNLEYYYKKIHLREND